MIRQYAFAVGLALTFTGVLPSAIPMTAGFGASVMLIPLRHRTQSERAAVQIICDSVRRWHQYRAPQSVRLLFRFKDNLHPLVLFTAADCFDPGHAPLPPIVWSDASQGLVGARVLSFLCRTGASRLGCEGEDPAPSPVFAARSAP